MKAQKKLESILLVCVLIAGSIVIILPMSAPKAKAQPIVHRPNTMQEDGQWPWDVDGNPNPDGIVVWDPNEDHHIVEDYTVSGGTTLVIPALNSNLFDPDSGNEITFKTDNTMIEVFGTLVTNTHTDEFIRTLFWGEGSVNWKGIYFRPGSTGNITECMFMGADNALVFLWMAPGSYPYLIAPGITKSNFIDMGIWGARLNGVKGYTNMEYCYFTDTLNSANSLRVEDMGLNMYGCTFNYHGNNKPNLFIKNANVHCTQSTFDGNNTPGNEVHIEGNSHGTVLERCTFKNGAPDEYFVNIDGSSPFLDNCTFETTHGELSVIANEKDAVPACPTIRNPSERTPGFWDDSFDNSTLNATGNSNITLQWYMNVNVRDPDGNSIDNAPVWVVDRDENPAEPPSKYTGTDGWANWTTLTELILYNDSVDNFNSFNVSALNNTIKGYLDPEIMMNMSKEVTVVVPFNPVKNTLTNVTSLSTPSGPQTGPITIEYMLIDPDIGDNGNLSIMVEFWDGTSPGQWKLATAHATCPPTDYLDNGTLYYFVWESNNSKDFGNKQRMDVKIRIRAQDKSKQWGPWNETGIFEVDNKPPGMSKPTVTPSNTSAVIVWMTDELANATVWYGPYVSGTEFDLVMEETVAVFDMTQMVTLTDLTPGRNYSFVMNSTDQLGNKVSSFPFTYSFETEIHIELIAGWNMISLPPILDYFLVADVLSPVDGNYDKVQAYIAFDTDDPWKHYLVGKPFGNDLIYIEFVMGLWIHMTSPDIFILDHKDPTPTLMWPGYSTIPLEVGWNFVGYPSVKTMAIGDALSGVPCDWVQTYDAASGQWLTWDGTDGDLTHMEMGRGYWIHCQNTHDWNVYYV
ncbi:MAG: fibronectin type III domain-containing protein [Methanomassiliicoccales archaeon]|nr:MAG: fibronectin type III domain-containing protein [Methanomassiliicoccales archaeon]